MNCRRDVSVHSLRDVNTILRLVMFMEDSCSVGNR